MPINRSPAPPRILWFDGTPGQMIIEVRTTDRTGLLALLTGVFERAGVDIAWAKVSTLGLSVVDTFCIVVPPLTSGDADHDQVREALERELYAVLPTAAPDKQVSEAS